MSHRLLESLSIVELHAKSPYIVPDIPQGNSNTTILKIIVKGSNFRASLEPFNVYNIHQVVAIPQQELFTCKRAYSVPTE